MVSCAAKLFRRKGRDETLEVKRPAISIDGKCGWRMESGRNEFRVFAFEPHNPLSRPGRRDWQPRVVAKRTPGVMDPGSALRFAALVREARSLVQDDVRIDIIPSQMPASAPASPSPIAFVASSAASCPPY